jgi:hypothetical protein
MGYSMFNICVCMQGMDACGILTFKRSSVAGPRREEKGNGWCGENWMMGRVKIWGRAFERVD